MSDLDNLTIGPSERDVKIAALEARASQAEKDLASALALVGEWKDTLKEAWEILDDPEYRADSFSAQPIRRALDSTPTQALSRLENRVKAEVWKEAAKEVNDVADATNLLAKAAALREGKS